MIVVSDRTRRLGWLCLLVLTAIFGLLVLPPLATPDPTVPVAKQPPGTSHLVAPQCGNLDVPSHYYTYEKGKESDNAFGPKVRATNATDELRRRLCGYTTPDGLVASGDWALLLALQGMVDGTNPNRPLTLQQWQEQVWEFTERIDWDRYYIVHEDARRESLFTLYMTGTPGTQPAIHSYWKGSQRASTYLLISVKQRSGDYSKLKLRLDCGFQPVYYHPDRVPKAIR